MSGSQSQVWVAGHDGRTLIRADAIMAVGQEGEQVTARLTGVDGFEVLPDGRIIAIYADGHGLDLLTVPPRTGRNTA